MAEEKMISELDLLKLQTDCREQFHKNGCFYGQTTAGTLENYIARYDSKMEGLETWIEVARNKTLPRIGDTADKGLTMAKDNAIEIGSLKKNINSLLIKIFFFVLAAVVGGVVSGNALILVVRKMGGS